MSELVTNDILLLQLLAVQPLHHFEIGPQLRRGLSRLWCQRLIRLSAGDWWQITPGGRMLVEPTATLH